MKRVFVAACAFALTTRAFAVDSTTDDQAWRAVEARTETSFKAAEFCFSRVYLLLQAYDARQKGYRLSDLIEGFPEKDAGVVEQGYGLVGLNDPAIKRTFSECLSEVRSGL